MKVFLKKIKMNSGILILAIMMGIVSIYIVGDMIFDVIKEIRSREK